MRRFERFMASQIIWIITVTALFLNLDFLRFSDNGILIIAGALMLTILINLGIWFGEGIARAFDDEMYDNLAETSATDELEKRKRERIDTVLRDMSNEDLHILQQRLQDGNINDEVLYEHIVGDDGELIRRN